MGREMVVLHVAEGREEKSCTAILNATTTGFCASGPWNFVRYSWKEAYTVGILHKKTWTTTTFHHQILKRAD